MALHTITLAHATDWPGFRQAARTLVQAGVPPQEVEWFTTQGAAQDLFAAPAPSGLPLDALPRQAGGPEPGVSASGDDRQRGLEALRRMF